MEHLILFRIVELFQLYPSSVSILLPELNAFGENGFAHILNHAHVDRSVNGKAILFADFEHFVQSLVSKNRRTILPSLVWDQNILAKSFLHQGQEAVTGGLGVHHEGRRHYFFRPNSHKCRPFCASGAVERVLVLLCHLCQ